VNVLKILHVITQLADFLGDAGQLIMISKHLQDLGHDVTIVTTDGDYFFSDKEASKMYDPMRKKLVEACKEPIYVNGVKIQAVHCMIPSMGMYCPSAQKFAKKIIKDFDVVHMYIFLVGIIMFAWNLPK